MDSQERQKKITRKLQRRRYAAEVDRFRASMGWPIDQEDIKIVEPEIANNVRSSFWEAVQGAADIKRTNFSLSQASEVHELVISRIQGLSSVQLYMLITPTRPELVFLVSPPVVSRSLANIFAIYRGYGLTIKAANGGLLVEQDFYDLSNLYHPKGLIEFVGWGHL